MAVLFLLKKLDEFLENKFVLFTAKCSPKSILSAKIKKF